MKEGTTTAADAGGLVGPDVVAACALSAVPGVGASSLARLVGEFKSLSNAMHAGPEAILRAGDRLRLRQETLDFLAREPDLLELGEWAVNAARAAGARVILLGDEWFPPLLRQIGNPPALLYVRGHLAPDIRRIAVVGSRDADEQGLELARSFGDGFARAGVQVVSGGARGVDQAVHDGVLWGSGTTVAVLGSGIDVPYPPENAELLDRIARGAGAVVSELPPGTQPSRHTFPRRNRIISGLSEAVVVVRAQRQSGALLTANHAADQNRKLFAVPGEVDNPLASGTNALIQRGDAKACRGPRDVLEALKWDVPEELMAAPQDDAQRQVVPSFPERKPPEKPAGKVTDEHQVIDEESLRLWRLLDDRTPSHVDDLALKAQIPAHLALRKLADLELRGMCVQRPGKYFLRR